MDTAGVGLPWICVDLPRGSAAQYRRYPSVRGCLRPQPSACGPPARAACAQARAARKPAVKLATRSQAAPVCGSGSDAGADAWAVFDLVFNLLFSSPRRAGCVASGPL